MHFPYPSLNTGQAEFQSGFCWQCFRIDRRKFQDVNLMENKKIKRITPTYLMKWQGFRVNSVCYPFGKLHCHCCHRYRHGHRSPPSSEMMNELLNCQFAFTCSSLQSLLLLLLLFLLLLLLLYTCSSNYPCGVASPASNWRVIRSISTAASELASTEVWENWIANAAAAAMNWWV